MKSIGVRRAILAAFVFLATPHSAPLSAAEAISCAHTRPQPSASSGIGQLGKESLNDDTDTLFLQPGDDLSDALQDIQPGTTMRLGPGTYPRFDLTGIKFDLPITIASADPNNPATIASLLLQDVKGVVFEDITFQTRQIPLRHTKPFQVLESANVRFSKTQFIGDQSAAHPLGQGLYVRASINISINRSVFAHWYRGAVFDRSSHLTIRDSKFTRMTSDGLNFSAVSDVRIEQNLIGHFLRDLNSDDHADMIQFWTRGTTTPNTNIVIKDNALVAGRGGFTHSIFMRNEVVDQIPTARYMRYANVQIVGNQISNAHTHGISIGQTDGLKIERNALTRAPNAVPFDSDPRKSQPTIRVHPDSAKVSITKNIVTQISGYEGQPTWAVHENRAPAGES